MASTEVEHYDGVDVAEVPSAAWGWSRINHRTWYITGVFIVGLLLAMVLFRNHNGHVEDWFVYAFAALTLVVLVRDVRGRRRGQIR